MKANAKLIRAAGGAERLRQLDASATDYKKVLKQVLTSELESVILTTEAEETSESYPTKLYHLLGQRNALRLAISLLDDIE